MTVSFATQFHRAESPTLNVENSAERVCRSTPVTDVGQVRLGGSVPQHLVEQELDEVIRDLDRASVKAMREGDPTGARLLARRMYEAIGSRTPEHQARLHAAVDARLADEMTFNGAWTHEVLNRAATHFNVSAQAVRRRMGRAG